jgi:hypothetical protein
MSTMSALRLSLVLVCLFSIGCGRVMPVPMVDRLEPEKQFEVDVAWHNMLTPPDRLDRTLLLDVLLLHQFHAHGVDRLRLTSEKWLVGGVVVMEVVFERDDPARDAFWVTYQDDSGNVLRQERYSRVDIEERLEFAFGDGLIIGDEDEEDPEIEALRAQRAAEREARMEEIQAATQPAVRP